MRRLQNSVFDHLTTYNVAPRPFPLCLRQAPRRYKTGEEKPLPEASKPGPGPNQEQLPHVSEEAAATSKAQGEKGPDLEQGTPVEEVQRPHAHALLMMLSFCLGPEKRSKRSREGA